MNVDAVYSYVVNCSWIFLTGWTVLLLSVCANAFRHDQV